MGYVYKAWYCSGQREDENTSKKTTVWASVRKKRERETEGKYAWKK